MTVYAKYGSINSSPWRYYKCETVTTCDYWRQNLWMVSAILAVGIQNCEIH